MASLRSVPELSGLFFDGDGTLWDFELVMRRALGVTLEHARKLRPGRETGALDVESLVEDRRTVGRRFAGAGLRLEELRIRAFEWTLQRIGIPDGAFARTLHEVYMRERLSDAALFEDALPVLRDLSQRMPIGLLSNGNGSPERSGLGGLFTVSVFADDHGVAKPDPRIFDVASKALGIDPARLGLVGDGLVADVGGALGAGWTAVWLNRIHSDSPCPSGAIEISTLRDLPLLLSR